MKQIPELNETAENERLSLKNERKTTEMNETGMKHSGMREKVFHSFSVADQEVLRQ